MPFYRCGIFDPYTFTKCKESVYVPYGGDPSSARCEQHWDFIDDSDSEVDDEFQSDGSELDDINVMIRGEWWTVISSQQFRELTMDCTPEARQNIYFLIEDYFNFLDSERAYGQQQNMRLEGLSQPQKRDLGMRIRDHIAQGRVYMASFSLSLADMASLRSSDSRTWGKLARTDASLVKIGYSKFFADERVGQLAQVCGIHGPRILTTFPSEQQNALGFVHLLEKIIHELCAGRQADVYCNGCGRTHKEYFVFEEIGGCTAKESVRLHVDSLKRDIMKWTHFLRQSHDLYNEVAFVQQNMLDKIKKQLWRSGHSTPW
ncbi:hypothetical protein CPC16_007902 [Podila verticillata]|nr:hypothetical protein BGZ59_003716 [Podila verticillata]KAF9385591.1 hypothetical protein CPC16_007902 [Podila verticillata]